MENLREALEENERSILIRQIVAGGATVRASSVISQVSVQQRRVSYERVREICFSRLRTVDDNNMCKK